MYISVLLCTYMNQTINVTDARQQWSKLVDRVFRSRERVIVEKSGIPVAAIISAADLERLTRMEAERVERFKVLDDIRDAFKDVSLEEIERQVAQAVAE